jgi:toxin ParE1/3/4
MPFAVRFTVSARNDLRALHAYISKHDSIENADYVAREIVRAAMTLREFPTRGAFPAELLQMGSRAYRQILFKPYRILYRIRAHTVFVAAIADGRRDLTALLARRTRRP